MTQVSDPRTIPGTLVRWFKHQRSYCASAGATATVVDFDGIFLNVNFVRDGLDNGQQNGGYNLNFFELASTPSQSALAIGASNQISIPCNCSDPDMARYGCRYLSKPDSKGSLHL